MAAGPDKPPKKAQATHQGPRGPHAQISTSRYLGELAGTASPSGSPSQNAAKRGGVLGEGLVHKQPRSRTFQTNPARLDLEFKLNSKVL